MCLQLKRDRLHNNPTVANEPIKCYKILFKRQHTNNTLGAPYRTYTYTIGDTHTTKLGKPTPLGCVNEGFHSFASLNDAERYKAIFFDNKIYDPWWRRNAVIVECIIPKGALLYEGKYINSTLTTNAYCSNMITITHTRVR